MILTVSTTHAAQAHIEVRRYLAINAYDEYIQWYGMDPNHNSDAYQERRLYDILQSLGISKEEAIKLYNES